LPAKLTDLNLWGTGYCASLNFRRTARAITRMYDSAMQGSGVRSTQFAILVGVAKTQPVSMGKLADVLGLDPTTMTRSLRLLQKEKMITISRRAAMRQRFLELTPVGEKALARSLPLWRKIQEQFVSTVGTDYWTKLRSELEGLARNTATIASLQETALSLKPDRNADNSSNAKN